MKVLVDGSVWIPFLRGQTVHPAEVSIAMEEGRSHLCPVVWIKIKRGIRGQREEWIAAELAALSPSLPMDASRADEAARLSRAAVQAGLDCPVAGVLLIALGRLLSGQRPFPA